MDPSLATTNEPALQSSANPQVIHIVEDPTTGRRMTVSPTLDSATGVTSVSAETFTQALDTMRGLGTADGIDFPLCESSDKEENKDLPTLDYSSGQPVGVKVVKRAAAQTDIISINVGHEEPSNDGTMSVDVPHWPPSTEPWKVEIHSRRAIEFLPLREMDHRGRADSVRVPRNWAGIIFEAIPCNKTHDRDAHAGLSTAIPSVFTHL